MPSQELQRHDATQAKKQQSGSSNGNTQSIPVDAGRTVARAQGEEAGDEGARGERREEVLTGEAINQCRSMLPKASDLDKSGSAFFSLVNREQSWGPKGSGCTARQSSARPLGLDQQSTCSRGRGGTRKDEWEKSRRIIYYL